MDKRILQLLLFWLLLDAIKPQNDYNFNDEYLPESRQNNDIVAAITTFGTCIINCITKTLPGGKCTHVFSCLWRCITLDPPPKKPPAALNRMVVGGRRRARQSSSGSLTLDQIAKFFGCFQDCLLGNVPTIDLSLTSLIHCFLSKCLCKF